MAPQNHQRTSSPAAPASSYQAALREQEGWDHLETYAEKLEALAERQEQVDADLERIKTLFKQQQYGYAARSLSDALIKYPDEPRLLRYWGDLIELILTNGKLDQAQIMLDHAFAFGRGPELNRLSRLRTTAQLGLAVNLGEPKASLAAAEEVLPLLLDPAVKLRPWILQQLDRAYVLALAKNDPEVATRLSAIRGGAMLVGPNPNQEAENWLTWFRTQCLAPQSEEPAQATLDELVSQWWIRLSQRLVPVLLPISAIALVLLLFWAMRANPLRVATSLVTPTASLGSPTPHPNAYPSSVLPTTTPTKPTATTAVVTPTPQVQVTATPSASVTATPLLAFGANLQLVSPGSPQRIGDWKVDFPPAQGVEQINPTDSLAGYQAYAGYRLIAVRLNVENLSNAVQPLPLGLLAVQDERGRLSLPLPYVSGSFTPNQASLKPEPPGGPAFGLQDPIPLQAESKGRMAMVLLFAVPTDATKLILFSPFMQNAWELLPTPSAQ